MKTTYKERPPISISFKCECHIIMQIQYTKNFNPGRFELGTTLGLFTWSGVPRSSGVGFFCLHALGHTKQEKLTPLDRGPPLHVNRVLSE